MGQFRIVEDAIIVPSTTVPGALGVLDAKGDLVRESTIWRHDRPLTTAPTLPGGDLPEIAGSHLYAGILSRHFGHFLVESLARLWPLTEHEDAIQSLLFVPKGDARRDRPIEGYQRDLLDMLAPRLPFQELKEPTRVERLIVPEQGWGTGKLEAGIPAQRQLFKHANWPEPEGEESRFIYVSRCELQLRRRGQLLGGKALATYLKERGYAPFHPQQHSIVDQIRAYRAAERAIFDDGSAVHLFGMVAHQPARVALLSRRTQSPPLEATGLRQLAAFNGQDLKVIDAVEREWWPQAAETPSSKSHAELSPPRVCAGLYGLGLAASPDDYRSLGLPSASEVEAEMTALGYRPVNRARPLPPKAIVASYHGVQVPDGVHMTPKQLKSLRLGTYERQELRNSLANIGRHDRVLELGAGAGVVGTVVAKHCQPEAMLSFEPNPELLPAIQAIHSANDVPPTVTAQQAVVFPTRDAPREVSFSILSGFRSSRLTSLDEGEGEHSAPQAREVQVPVVPFPEIVETFRPTALIMDIEGAELEFLPKADLSSLRVIVVELHRNLFGRPGMKACREALRAQGFARLDAYSARWVDTWVKTPAPAL